MGIFRDGLAGAGMAGAAGAASRATPPTPGPKAGAAAIKLPVVLRNFLRLTESDFEAMKQFSSMRREKYTTTPRHADRFEL
jgi:hypothetical protein